MEYKIDIKRIIDGKIQLQGWVLPKEQDIHVNFIIKDSYDNDINFNLVRVKR